MTAPLRTAHLWPLPRGFSLLGCVASAPWTRASCLDEVLCPALVAPQAAPVKSADLLHREVSLWAAPVSAYRGHPDAGIVEPMTALPVPTPADLPALQQAVDDAEHAEASIAMTCRAMWAAVKDADDETKATVKAAIDRVLERAEDASDLAAARLGRVEYDAGAPTIPWDQVEAELADA